MTAPDHTPADHEERRAPDPALEPVSPELTAPASGRFRDTEALASAVGNQGFATIARQGAGILPDGKVHPDVESAIARTRGAGETLDPRTQERFSPALGDMGDVRVHNDSGADALARAVNARAFATGTDVYFARGQYQPGTHEGDRLLAHELTHVVQQRGAATGGPLTVSQPGDAMETQADTTAHELAG
jgi:hypothetical protein